MQIDTSYNMTRENPWNSEILEKETWVSGTISNKTKFGLFVSLKIGI